MNLFIRTTHLLRLLPILLLFGATLLTGCSGGKEGNGEDEMGEVTEESAATETRSDTKTDRTSGNTPVSTAPDDFRPVITHTATLVTTLGKIELELYGVDAPKTVANFVGLAERNEYDSVLFHRVVPGFVIQGGDPKSKNPALKSQWGTGGSTIYGAEFEDELDENSPSGKRGYIQGTLAMANRGPNTNTSQFFIILKDGTGLPFQYTIFGYVREGMDVVNSIVQNGSGAPPPNPVRITDVTVTEYQAIDLGE